MTIFAFMISVAGLLMCSFAWYKKGLHDGEKRTDQPHEKRTEVVNQIFANIDAYNGSEIGQKAVRND